LYVLSVSLHHKHAKDEKKDDTLQYFFLSLNILLLITPRHSKNVFLFPVTNAISLLIYDSFAQHIISVSV